MPTPQYRIVFHNPPAPDKYYHRDEIIKIGGINQTRPMVTSNVGEAHTFLNRDSVIAFRDQYRGFYPTITIFVEDIQHNGPLFEEYGRESTDTGEPDTRTWMVVCPDDLIAQDLWFVVKPANTVNGRVWCVRPADVPSLKESLGKIDTIYGRIGENPDEVLERARRHWKSLGLKVEGSPHPNGQKVVEEVEQSKFKGRRRPGDL